MKLFDYLPLFFRGDEGAEAEALPARLVELIHVA